MNETKLGSLIYGDEQRDAIHFAIAPVEADGMLSPGTHVGLTREKKASAHERKKIGVVDPFLNNPVRPGERFWLVLYQDTVTRLRRSDRNGHEQHQHH
jgi:hypothetical protein